MQLEMFPEHAWLKMELHPKITSRKIELLFLDYLPTGQAVYEIKEGHYACDLGGSEQPPFEGYFYAVKDSNGETIYNVEFKKDPIGFKWLNK